MSTTTTPSFFNVTSGTQKSIETPPGTIVPYLGTTDPDGWVICDGSQRNYDSIYDELVSLSYGTKSDSGTYYYPINLQNTFLRGGTDNLGSFIGDGTLKIPLVKHYHDVKFNNTSSHSHIYDIPSISHQHGVTSTNTNHSHSISSITYNDKHTHSFDQPLPQHQHGILVPGDDFNFKGGNATTTWYTADADVYADGKGDGSWTLMNAVMSTWNNIYNQGYQQSGNVQNPKGENNPQGYNSGSNGGLWQNISGTTSTNDSDETKTTGLSLSHSNVATSITNVNNLDSTNGNIDVTIADESININVTTDAIGNGDSIELNPSNYTVVFIMKL